MVVEHATMLAVVPSRVDEYPSHHGLHHHGLHLTAHEVVP
jgi:hypothetical protein